MQTLGLIGTRSLHVPLTASVKERLSTKYATISYDDLYLHYNYASPNLSKLVKIAQGLKDLDVQAFAFTSLEIYGLAERISEQVDLPYLDFGSIVGCALREIGVRRLGFLGSKAIMQRDFITAQIATSSGLEIFSPENDSNILQVHKILTQNLPTGRYTKVDEDRVFKAIFEMHINHGIEGVILAYPEFNLILNDQSRQRLRHDNLDNPDFRFIDAHQIFVEALADFCCS